ncbi:hypothetical protein ACWDTI_27180 [Gordonia sp. NPDC003424]
MRTQTLGQFAFLAGVIAARIHAYPLWQWPLFDDHHVRLDLEAQVTAITASAAALHLRSDADVIGAYIEKARALDRRAEGILERLNAFAEYRAVVAGIQEREDKRVWLDRVGAIDDFESSVDEVVNRGQTEHIRGVAVESEFLAAMYLDTLEPLTASLAVAEVERSVDSHLSTTRTAPQ